MNLRRLRHGTVAVAVLLASPFLTSCGFNAPTTQIYNPTVGVSDQTGLVDVLNVLVVSTEDGSGTLVAGFANNDDEDDSLSGVQAGGDDSDVQVQVGGPTDIPAGELLDISDEGGVTLEGGNVVPGSFVTLRFTFDRAASVTVDAPVVEYSEEGPYHHVPVG